MKKKLDTRFPAARIKKIMQADEDVGKIAAATPVLMSKALEMFLQDLLDKTFVVTAARGVKTVSTNHLRTCIQSNQVFDFLKEVATRVPDLGGESECNDEKLAGHGHRRKIKDEDQESSGEDVKRMRIDSVSTASTSGQKHAPHDRSNGQKKGADGKGEHRLHSRNGNRTPKLESEERSLSDPKVEELSLQAASMVKMNTCKAQVQSVNAAPCVAKIEYTDEKMLARDDRGGQSEMFAVVDDSSTMKRTPRDFDLNVGLDDDAFDDVPEEKPVVEVLKEKGNNESEEKPVVKESEEKPVVKEKGVFGVDDRNVNISSTPRASGYDGGDVRNANMSSTHWAASSVEDDYDCEDDEDG
eukprot:TRINITY_DN68_c0_g1_i1.p1 TRINITY_DN68_c0_g1~~TRINITY_DN68_c0_g1_i1.p1  ORF type:complete len:356 (+),score=97.29 TRINITY_DN68_c0_g1_i1:446-1513(+)